MKSFLKKLKGCCKLSTLALPFVLTLGGIAGITGIATSSNHSSKAVLDETRSNEVVQEIIQEEEKSIEEKHSNGTLSLEEYNEQMDYLKSDKFITDLFKNNEDLKEFADKYNSASNKQWFSLLFCLPTSIGMASVLLMYTNLFNDNYYDGKLYHEIIDSAKEDFDEAKMIKSAELQAKELDEYNEQL